MSDQQVEPLLMITMDPPREGANMTVDGEPYTVVRVLMWTGTVARLEITPRTT